MKTAERLDTHQKALRINLDKGKYGVFAEIGAGQEVARWFFRVGGAAGTIAKSISAYDMIISDAIYGPSKRYVSRQRLEKMLEYEYGLLHERLKEKRGSNTRFFVFADTVTARSYTRQDEGQGWLGVRLQVAPERPPSEVIIHVRMLDKENVQQQETLGAVGVNLIYGALYLSDDPDEFVASLMDGLNPERLEVDMIRFSGPDFAKIDNRIASLQLVQKGLSNAAMFNADGEVIQASDFLYKKPILVLYNGRTRADCGGQAQSAMGPFYCPADQKVYLDTSFFEQIATRFRGCDAGSKSCQFAQAYVIAHEIGHHVQNQLGILQKAQQLQRSAGDKAEANAIQVRVELQADCLAGVWANRENESLRAQGKQPFVEPGDIETALRTAAAIGDDTLQRRSQGYVVPDSFTHGSAEQRQRWFANGYKSGQIGSCNTFGSQNI